MLFNCRFSVFIINALSILWIDILVNDCGPIKFKFSDLWTCHILFLFFVLMHIEICEFCWIVQMRIDVVNFVYLLEHVILSDPVLGRASDSSAPWIPWATRSILLLGESKAWFIVLCITVDFIILKIKSFVHLDSFSVENWLWVVIIELLVCLFSLLLLLVVVLFLFDAFFGPLPEVDPLWKFAVIVDFESLHCVIVKFKAFEVDDYHVWQVLQVAPAMGAYLAIVLLAMVLVVSFQHVWLDVHIQGFWDRFLVLDVQSDRVKSFISLTKVWIFRLQRLCLVADRSTDWVLQEVMRINIYTLIFERFWNQLFNLIT